MTERGKLSHVLWGKLSHGSTNVEKKIANQCSDTTLINGYICSLESASNYKYDSIKNDMSDFRNRLKNYVIIIL